MQKNTQAIILAAGKGTRMKTEHPKCLTPLGNKTFLDMVLLATESVCDRSVVVVGYKGEEVINHVSDGVADFVWQKEQLGTGHAVAAAKDISKSRDLPNTLVLMGDQPLISGSTLEELVKVHSDKEATITLLTAVVPDFENEFSPFLRFGRIIRDEHNAVDKIVEYKDATEEEKNIKEVNIGTYIFDSNFLWQHIEKLGNKNASGEYYITDLIQIAFEEGKKVLPFVLPDTKEAFGVNSPEDLEIVKNKI
ncbi:NTP transferase domain-containing protein [Candidatus Nomurabacteria bacterium]|nr:NTP transferase domain-containing protein [Candidatus Nomurabacteria bacterium]MCB9820510.1 NTP transferase domain-containing protein [Candidatus Nomurabacteria bacterium]